MIELSMNFQRIQDNVNDNVWAPAFLCPKCNKRDEHKILDELDEKTSLFKVVTEIERVLEEIFYEGNSSTTQETSS